MSIVFLDKEINWLQFRFRKYLVLYFLNSSIAINLSIKLNPGISLVRGKIQNLQIIILLLNRVNWLLPKNLGIAVLEISGSLLFNSGMAKNLCLYIIVLRKLTVNIENLMLI